MTTAPNTSPRPALRGQEAQVPETTLVQWSEDLQPVVDALAGSEWLVPFLLWLGAVLIVLLMRGHRLRQANRAVGRVVLAQRPGRCRWKRDRATRDTLIGWKCRTCGVRAYSSDGTPPKECKRDLRARPL